MRNNFKFFQQWVRKNGHKLKHCDCGFYEGEHDPTCSLVVSEELLYELWQSEVAKQNNQVN